MLVGATLGPGPATLLKLAELLKNVLTFFDASSLVP